MDNFHGKEYCNKTTQTDIHHYNVLSPEGHYPDCLEGHAKAPSDIPPAELEHLALVNNLDRPRKMIDGMTTESKVEYSSLASTPASPGSSRSPTTSHRILKHPQILYGRPVGFTSLARRFVSVPETSFSDTLGHKNTSGRSLRVVSLPMHTIRHSSLMTNDSTPPPDISLDSQGTSLYTPSSSSRQGSVDRKTYVHPISELPKTPSPPSSPESILIIGNNARFPGSFRQEIHPCSGTHNDSNGGWIPWAGSPPKPIPALHGPLSLPYARCPSGAEGTLIDENADLPHMIWGLGLDDHQHTHTRHHSDLSGEEKLFLYQHDSRSQQNSLSRFTENAHDNDTSHSLKSGDNTVGGGRVLGGIPIRTAHGVPSGGFGVRPYHDHTMTQDWQSACLEPLQHDKKYKSDSFLSLRSSIAPLPTISRTQPRISVEPRLGPPVHPIRRKSVIESMYQYDNIEQQDNFLPTPSSSSVPQWSPVFPGFLSEELFLRDVQRPLIYENRLGDFNEPRRFTQDLIQPNFSIIPSGPSRTFPDRPILLPKGPRAAVVLASNPLNSVHQSKHGFSSSSMLCPPSPTPLGYRPKPLGSQRLHSASTQPFNQRRLSLVVEETIGINNDVPLDSGARYNANQTKTSCRDGHFAHFKGTKETDPISMKPVKCDGLNISPEHIKVKQYSSGREATTKVSTRKSNSVKSGRPAKRHDNRKKGEQVNKEKENHANFHRTKDALTNLTIEQKEGGQAE